MCYWLYIINYTLYIINYYFVGKSKNKRCKSQQKSMKGAIVSMFGVRQRKNDKY